MHTGGKYWTHILRKEMEYMPSCNVTRILIHNTEEMKNAYSIIAIQTTVHWTCDTGGVFIHVMSLDKGIGLHNEVLHCNKQFRIFRTQYLYEIMLYEHLLSFDKWRRTPVPSRGYMIQNMVQNTTFIYQISLGKLRVFSYVWRHNQELQMMCNLRIYFTQSSKEFQIDWLYKSILTNASQ